MTNKMFLRLVWFCLLFIVLLHLFVVDDLSACAGWTTAYVFYTIIMVETNNLN